MITSTPISLMNGAGNKPDYKAGAGELLELARADSTAQQLAQATGGPEGEWEEPYGLIRTNKITQDIEMHPWVALQVARWLSPVFDLVCTPEYVRDMMDDYLQGAPEEPNSFRHALMAELVDLSPQRLTETTGDSRSDEPGQYEPEERL